MEGRSFKDLIAWQKGLELAEAVYRATRTWPRDETFGLTSQARRAASSVVANVAEGQSRNGVPEFLHHLSIAHGSLAELETHLLLAQRVDYIADGAIEPLADQIDEVRRLLRGLIRSLRRPTSRTPDS